MALRRISLLACTALAAATARSAGAQHSIGPFVRPAVVVDTATLALRHVRVIDGTGSVPKEDQTVVIAKGRIASVGPAGATPTPPGALVLDRPGASVVPGLVMLHEHLFYPKTQFAYSPQAVPFSQLLLAAGVTTARTAGGVSVTEDINVGRLVRAWQLAGPTLHVTGTFLAGSALSIPQIPLVSDSAAVLRQVEHWAGEGATSVKVYTGLPRSLMQLAVTDAHSVRQQVLAHLCSVTFADAAAIGVDHIEHGFLTATDFVAGKKPDECPPNDAVLRAFLQMPVDDPRVQSLFKTLVEHHVGITSTLPVFEIYARDSIPSVERGLAMLVPELRDRFRASHAATRRALGPFGEQVLAHEQQFERAFVRAGGTLTIGTDPTGIGGVVPPYANQRALELLVEAGFTPLEVLRMATLNGALELGIASDAGTIAVGKRADLVVVNGDPSRDITLMQHPSLVFKDGVAFDPERLIAPLRGRIGAP